MEKLNVSHKEVLESLGDFEKLSKGLERFREDQVFVDEHFEDLYLLYPEQFIAVRDKRVIASASTMEDFLEIMQGDEGRQRASVWRYLEKNPRPLIVTAI